MSADSEIAQINRNETEQFQTFKHRMINAKKYKKDKTKQNVLKTFTIKQ